MFVGIVNYKRNGWVWEDNGGGRAAMQTLDIVRLYKMPHIRGPYQSISRPVKGPDYPIGQTLIVHFCMSC